MRLSLSELRLYAADGSPIALERKAFDLIAYLVQQRDRVVAKDELLKAVWGRSVASDSVVAQAVSKARKALASGGGDADWIDVARGVGYRYVGPAEPWLGSGPPSRAPFAPSRRPVRVRMSLVLALMVAVVLGLLFGAAWQRKQQSDPLRIAVLPFRDDSGQADLEWTSLGLQGLLLDALASDRRVVPIPQGSVRALLAARPDLADAKAQADYLGAATGAQHVYAGRLSRDESALVVELVVLGQGEPRSLRLVGEDPTGLALAAGSRVTQHLLPGFDPARPAPLSTQPYANEAYARGVDARVRGRAGDAVQHLQSALSADPDLLAARYQLSIAFQQLRRNDDWLESLQRLLDLARARGDRVHEGLALGGLGVHAWREGRFTDAEALIQQAWQLFDASSDGLRRASASGNLGSLAAIQGRFDEAERHMRDALQTFDQAGLQVESARVSKNLGVMDSDRGRFADARQHFERSRHIRQALGLERDLAETLVSLGVADLALESPDAARASLERAVEIFIAYKDPLQESDALARLARVHIEQGRLQLGAQTAARSLASGRVAGNAAAMGLAHLRLAEVARLRGDTAGALTELEHAEAVWQPANEAKGLLNIALQRAALRPTTERERARRETSDVLEAARAHGWAALEVEAQAQLAELAGTPDAALQLLQHAYDKAQAIGEPALITASACRLARHADDDEAVAAPARRCSEAAPHHADAARFLAERAEAAGQNAAALRWWRQCQALSGERWSPADQARLDALTAG